MIYADMLEAKKVVFLRPIFESDFPERGMKAWLTKIERIPEDDNGGELMYKLYFDFGDFEDENDKYFTECYYPNNHTKDLPDKSLYTAKEAGMYNRKYSVYYSESEGYANALFNLSEYIKEIR